MRPGLLERLSLKTYQTSNVTVDIHLNASCSEISEELDEIKMVNSTCTNIPQLLHQLNIMTANVSLFGVSNVYRYMICEHCTVIKRKKTKKTTAV